MAPPSSFKALLFSKVTLVNVPSPPEKYIAPPPFVAVLLENNPSFTMIEPEEIFSIIKEIL